MALLYSILVGKLTDAGPLQSWGEMSECRLICNLSVHGGSASPPSKHTRHQWRNCLKHRCIQQERGGTQQLARLTSLQLVPILPVLLVSKPHLEQRGGGSLSMWGPSSVFFLWALGQQILTGLTGCGWAALSCAAGWGGRSQVLPPASHTRLGSRNWAIASLERCIMSNLFLVIK